MATTKRAGAGRPTIGSSHAGKTTGKPTGKPSRPGKPGPGRSTGTGRPAPSAKPRAGSSGPPKRSARPAEKPAPKKRALPKKVGERKPASPPSRRPPEIRSAPSEASRSAAIEVATAALDKKAVNVQIFDVVGRVDYADFLVLMSGRSNTHVRAIADAIEEAMLKAAVRRKPTAVEGRDTGNWVVLDFGDLVAHVFQEEARSFYDLDTLWQDARRIPVSAS